MLITNRYANVDIVVFDIVDRLGRGGVEDFVFYSYVFRMWWSKVVDKIEGAQTFRRKV